MNQSIQVQALSPSKAEILIFAPIGEGLFGDGLTAAQFDSNLKALGDVTEILVRINSPGGAVFDGFSIYNILKQHPARIRVQIDGVAASIASVIAMAGDRIEMGEGGMLMIHNPWTLSAGDAEDLRHTAEMLDKVKLGMVAAYVSRTGIKQGKILQMMDAETWLTADESVAQKFADGYVETPEQSPRIAAANWRMVFAQFQHPPEKLLRKLEMEPATPTPNAALSPEARRCSDVNALLDQLEKIPALENKGSFLDNLRARAILNPTLNEQSVRNEILAELEKDTRGAHLPPTGAGRERYESDNFLNAAADGLLIRAGIRIAGTHPAANDTQSLSLHDMARTCLAQAGRREGYLTGQRLIKAAMSTSDFPAILENSLHKAIRQGYEMEPASHRQWVRLQPVSDFRDQPRPILGSAPELEEVLELGEYKYGSMTDDGASYRVTKYGKIVALSWEALVNDDLGAFLRVQPALGQAARRKEADTVYGLFTDNAGDGQTMQDAVTLFHADHDNLATAGALSATTLGAARALLRKQTAVGGGYLGLVPRFLIVSAESETAAEILLASATRHLTTTSDAAQPGWMANLELVVEPRLAATAFYLATGSDQIDTVELGVLDADGPGPAIEEETTFDTDAKRWKVRHTFGAKFLDWRGIVKVPAS